VGKGWLNIEHSTLNIEHRREEKEEEKRKRIYREGAKVAKGRGVRRVKSSLPSHSLDMASPEP
jgi:hypothetical protein